MSADILRELEFLIRSMILGISITFVYDILRIFRRVIRHNLFFISLEDICYWICCTLVIFEMLYQENNGVVRWFVIMGAGFGMLSYRATLSRFFVKLSSMLIGNTLSATGKVFGTALKPLQLLFKFLKKKLTVFKKVFRIVLCKR